MIDEKLIERSFELGKYFLEKLRAIKSKHIVEVRGRGLWIGLELNTNARPFCEALMKENILCKETHNTLFRFAPPLVIKKRKFLGGGEDWGSDEKMSNI